MSDDAVKRRSPWIAGLFALFCPGLGHLYATEIRRSLPFFAVSMLLNAVAWVLPYVPPSPALAAFLFATLGTSLLFVVYSAYDAVRCARRNGTATLTRYNRWPVYLGLFLAISLVKNASPLVPDSWGWKSWDFHSVASGSMTPTLRPGERLVAWHMFYATNDPQAGDLVVFLYRQQNALYIKRIVGLPGQRVQLAGGVLRIDGQPVQRQPTDDFVSPRTGQPVAQYIETLPNGRSYRVLQDGGKLADTEEVTVPEGSYFLLGDNRGASMDSRIMGAIPREDLRGKEYMILWSSDLGRIGQPLD